ncbi:MAG: hypothetical protein GWN58_22895 [Anaerolineae bacterium]|nr:hypothetical protein [Thermoplasmata archaeon]NIV32223.1 hypothetical protein [Anaerolineae bacterium]NIY03675.1 hypothetical protein [Thermoplasmata archaeon]
MYSEIVPGRLWAGSINSVKPENMRALTDKGLVCVVSCLPIGQVGAFPPEVIEPKPKAHHILTCWDDEVVEPKRIDYAIHLNVPTLIHCNAGQNRSTCIAACWLLKHDGWLTHPSTTWQEALVAVTLKRRELLGREPKVYDEMRENVRRYAEWLRARTASPTGRLRHSEPAMQNVPIKSELGSRIKKAFRGSE